MSESISPTDPDIKRLVRGLIGFLQEQVRLAHRQVRDAIDGSVFWFADAGEHVRPADSRVLLEIEQQAPPSPPTPPALLQRWLDRREWIDANGPNPSLVDPDDEDRPPPEDVQEMYDQWIPRWEEWAGEERGSAAERRRSYERLDRLRREASQRTDTHELVLGVGLLSAQADNGWAVRRHLLVWPVQIDPDPDSGALQVRLPIGLEPRVEDGDFLGAGDGYLPEQPNSPWLEPEVASLHPLSSEAKAWLNAWQSRCWQGNLSFLADDWNPPRLGEGATTELRSAPAVFIRQRDRSGLESYYEEMAKALGQVGTAPPLGLAQLVTCLNAEQRLNWLHQSDVGQRSIVGDDPLLALPTNQEQRRVLERLRSDTGVVVQGPPGTGKTHTIANLICALLADGQRVLITSEKEQALRVLRKTLPPVVRQLCVLMTGMAAEGADELERSITALSDLAATTTPDRLRYDISTLRQQRSELLTALQRAGQDLQVARSQEHVTHSLGLGGYGGTLADLVQAINDGREPYSWIDPLPAAASGKPPLSNDEIGELRQLLLTATPERALRAEQQIPPPHLLPPSSVIAAATAAVVDAERILGPDHTATAWSLAHLSDTLLAELSRHVDAAAIALADCGLPETTAEWDTSDWRLDAIEALFARRNRAYWATLFDEVTAVERHIHALEALDGCDVEFGATVSPSRLLGQAKQLRSYLSRGRRLRRWWPAPAQATASDLLELCTIDGAPPTTAANLATLIVHLQAEKAVNATLQAWEPVGVPNAHGALRHRVAQVKDIAHSVTGLKKLTAAREAIEQALRRNGVRYAIRTSAHWDLVVRVARTGPTMAKAQRAAEGLARITDALSHWSTQEDAAPEVAEVVAALRTRNTAAYAAARKRLEQARVDSEAEVRAHMLHARLAEAHPTAAAELKCAPDDVCWNDRLGSFEEAWSWGNAVAYHRAVRDPDREQRLTQRADESEQLLLTVTAELAGKQALLHWLDRLTETQRKALQSYKNAMGRYGKGRGRHSDRQLKAATEAMKHARYAVPAWVMPLSTVASTIPAQQNTFDIVIVDEASQARIDSLFLLWLAPRIVAVGDDKQCAPGLSQRIDLKAAEASIDHHLEGMPLHLRNSFSPRSNLYELLSTHFPDVVRLSEHFRCMPEIINWSSMQFYQNRLVPLRQFGGDRLDPLKVVWVDDAQEEGLNHALRNPVEAEAIIDQVQKMVEEPLYRGRTIGIIALQEGKQTQMLDTLLKRRISQEDIDRFGIRVGQPPDFQGDERDVVLLSMVVTKGRRALARREEAHRYNVAATRARDQLWLFVSVTPEALASGGLRQSLLAYMMNPPAALATDPNLDDLTEDDLHPPFQSLLEQRVFLALRRRGYAVVPQFPVYDGRIDLVVVGDNGRLAVECDSPALPVTPEKIEQDLQRERELRRAKWWFVRIRDSEYLYDPQVALEALWTSLAQRGIQPRSLPAAPRGQVRWTPIPLPAEEDEDLGDSGA